MRATNRLTNWLWISNRHLLILVGLLAQFDHFVFQFISLPFMQEFLQINVREVYGQSQSKDDKSGVFNIGHCTNFSVDSTELFWCSLIYSLCINSELSTATFAQSRRYQLLQPKVCMKLFYIVKFQCLNSLQWNEISCDPSPFSLYNKLSRRSPKTKTAYRHNSGLVLFIF